MKIILSLLFLVQIALFSHAASDQTHDECRKILEVLGILVDGQIHDEPVMTIETVEQLQQAIDCLEFYEKENQRAEGETQKTCTLAPEIERGKIVSQTVKSVYAIGDEALYVCDDGYTLSQNIPYTVCVEMDNGTVSWTEPIPLCTRTCSTRGAPTNLLNGFVTNIKPSGYNTPDKVSYVCDRGYRTADGEREVVISCLPDGSWDIEAPTACMKEGSGGRCRSPPSISNGVRISHENAYPTGLDIYYRCNTGYEFVDDIDYTSCKSSGEWSEIPQCRIVKKGSSKCGPPPRVPYGNPVSNTDANDVGSIIAYECIPGYILNSDDDFIICTPGGKWSPRPSCISNTITCDSPPSLPNTRAESNKREYAVGETVQYSCTNIDIGVKGEANCANDGEWRILKIPDCTVNTCINPPRFPGSVPSSNDEINEIETIVTYTCDGRTTVTQGSVICQTSGEWLTLSEPECKTVVKCGRPPNFGEAIPIATQNEYDEGDSVKYICQSGKEIDNSQAVCQGDGEWRVAVQPECTEGCKEAEEITGQERSHVLEIHPINDLVTYTCRSAITIKKGVTVCQSDGRWSTPVSAVCEDEEITCGNPGQLANGAATTVLKSSYINNERVEYRCYLRHEMIGDNEIKCEDGSWTKKPNCVPFQGCRSIGVENGEVVKEKRSYAIGEELEYFCFIGFEKIGTSVCGSDKQWSKRPLCQRVSLPHCPAPGSIRNGELSSPNMPYNVDQEASYKCNVGYQFVGESRITCQPNREWTPRPVCESIENTCGRPGAIENGDFVGNVGNSYTPKSRVTYECDSDYSFVGSRDYVECQINGEWTPRPRCEENAVTCTDPPILENGNFKERIKSSYSPGSRVTYVCNDDYTPMGKLYVVCGSKGSWSLPPSCEKQEPRCRQPKAIKNGKFRNELSQTYKLRSRVYFVCDSNFIIKGTGYVECKTDGSWTSYPSCEEKAKTCGIPKSIENGKPRESTKSSYKPGERVSFLCASGYILKGTYITCQSDGSWNSYPECEKTQESRNCRAPKYTIANGRMSRRPSGSSYRHGTTFRYYCYRGYTMTGSSTITCQQNGEWTSQPTCSRQSSSTTSAPPTASTCSAPPSIANGRLYSSTRSSYRVSYKLRYRCYESYYMTGSAYVTCQDDGTWTKPPTCTVASASRCSYPPRVEDGSSRQRRSSYNRIGTVISYYCKSGYDFVDSVSSVTCQSDGSWSKPAPQCMEELKSSSIDKYCKTPPTIEHGTRRSYINSRATYFEDGTRVYYNCNSGYSLSNSYTKCKKGRWEDVPDCEPSSPSGCRNGGSSSGSDSNGCKSSSGSSSSGSS